MKKKSVWTDVDHAAVDLVIEWLSVSTPHITKKQVAEYLGYSYEAMFKKLDHRGNALTLGEFTTLCTLFHKEPAHAWLEILRNAAKQSGDEQTSIILNSMLNDHIIKEKIVDLAIRYTTNE